MTAQVRKMRGSYPPFSGENRFLASGTGTVAGLSAHDGIIGSMHNSTGRIQRERNLVAAVHSASK